MRQRGEPLQNMVRKMETRNLRKDTEERLGKERISGRSEENWWMRLERDMSCVAIFIEMDRERIEMDRNG